MSKEAAQRRMVGEGENEVTHTHTLCCVTLRTGDSAKTSVKVAA